MIKLGSYVFMDREYQFHVRFLETDWKASSYLGELKHAHDWVWADWVKGRLNEDGINCVAFYKEKSAIDFWKRYGVGRI